MAMGFKAKGILLTGGKHILQSIERWGQQPVVITVTKNSMIFSKYSAYIGVTFNLKMDTQLLFFLCIITWFKSFRNSKFLFPPPKYLTNYGGQRKIFEV